MKRRKFILLSTFYILLIIIIYFIFTKNFYLYKVSGDSMFPTYKENNILLLQKNINNIKRNDVIVYKTIQSDDVGYILKRVIGIPGDTLTLNEDNTITINGEIYDDVYGYYSDEEGFITNMTYTLSDDEYFTIGDNRNHSIDSRSVGTIKRDRIIAKNIIKIFPFELYKLIGKKDIF